MSSYEDKEEYRISNITAEPPTFIIPEPSNWNHVHAEVIKHQKRKRFYLYKKIISLLLIAILSYTFFNKYSNERTPATYPLYMAISNQLKVLMSSIENNYRIHQRLLFPPLLKTPMMVYKSKISSALNIILIRLLLLKLVYIPIAFFNKLL